MLECKEEKTKAHFIGDIITHLWYYLYVCWACSLSRESEVTYVTIAGGWFTLYRACFLNTMMEVNNRRLFCRYLVRWRADHRLACSYLGCGWLRFVFSRTWIRKAVNRVLVWGTLLFRQRFVWSECMRWGEFARRVGSDKIDGKRNGVCERAREREGEVING